MESGRYEAAIWILVLRWDQGGGNIGEMRMALRSETQETGSGSLGHKVDPSLKQGTTVRSQNQKCFQHLDGRPDVG